MNVISNFEKWSEKITSLYNDKKISNKNIVFKRGKRKNIFDELTIS